MDISILNHKQAELVIKDCLELMPKKVYLEQIVWIAWIELM
jgi:uncharacterized protein Smg (DUF494 family)